MVDMHMLLLLVCNMFVQFFWFWNISINITITNHSAVLSWSTNHSAVLSCSILTRGRGEGGGQISYFRTVPVPLPPQPDHLLVLLEISPAVYGWNCGVQLVQVNWHCKTLHDIAKSCSIWGLEINKSGDVNKKKAKRMTTCKKDGGGWVKFIISLKVMRKRRVGVKSSCHDFWRS